MTLVDAISLTPESRRRRTVRHLRIGVALILVLASLPLVLNIDILFALALLGGPLLPLFCAYLLLSTAGGRKSVVVYLRRFGRTASNQAVTTALESGLSRRHRIVTLDDSRFLPLEVPPWERRMSRYGPPLLAAALILLFVFTVRALRQQLEVLFLWLLVGTVPLLAASLWSVLTVFLLLMIHRWRIRGQARSRIASPTDVDAQVARLFRLLSWWYAPGGAAPQATVLRVDDGMWQQTVEALVRDCSAVLIDVSEPTINLAWEIETALQEAANRVVLVGDRSAVLRWSADGSAAADQGAVGTAAALLVGRTILSYDVSDRRGRRRFRQSLLRALDNVALAIAPRRAAPPAIPWWRRCASYAVVIAIYLMAPVVAGVLSYIAFRVANSQQMIADLFWNEHHPLDRPMSAETELNRRNVPPTPGSLARAARNGKDQELTWLLEAGVPPAFSSAGGWTPLLLAAKAGNAAAIGALLQAGANADERTADGRSAVMLAAGGGHTTALQTLVASNANVNVGAANRTALGLAIQSGRLDAVGVLLDRGANVSTPHLGMSPLVLASAIGRADIVERLLARGAEVDVRSHYGRTALGLAAIAGCGDCVRGLLSKGAVVDAVDAFGETASSYAAFNGDTATVAILREAGASLTVVPSDQRRDGGRHAGRPKPHMNLAIASAVDTQAPALVSAMSRATAGSGPRAAFLPAERLEAQREGLLPTVPRGSLDVRGTLLEFSTSERHCALCLTASDADFRKAMMSDRCRVDAVLIVTSPASIGRRLEDQVIFARQGGVADVVVALEIEPSNDDGRSAADEPAIRRVLAKYGYDTAAIVRVSSSGALKGEERWQASIEELLRAIDRTALPVRSREAPLLMVVEDVIPRHGEDTIVVVHVEAGTVSVGDTIEIVGLRTTPRTTTVQRIEGFRKALAIAEAGDRVGVIMKNVTAEHVDRGQVIAHLGTIEAHTQFEATVYWLSPDEGGRLTPVADGYRPYLNLRTAMATASFTFPQNPSGPYPGGTSAARVALLNPVAMAPGLRFAVREGAQTVGIGIVTRVF